MNEEPLMSEWCLANCFDISIWKIVLHLKSKIEEIKFSSWFQTIQNARNSSTIFPSGSASLRLWYFSSFCSSSAVTIVDKNEFNANKNDNNLNKFAHFYWTPSLFSLLMLNMKAINGKFCEVITFMQSELWVNYSKWAPNYPKWSAVCSTSIVSAMDHHVTETDDFHSQTIMHLKVKSIK